MSERVLTEPGISEFREYLILQEKSQATVEKYLRDVRAFSAFLGGRPVTKEVVMAYKQCLLEKGYAVRSINSMLASLNSLLEWQGWQDCKVRSLKLQNPAYCAEDQELTKSEYLRLLAAAKQQPRLRLILETICGTGIRVSELRFFTVEGVTRGEISVHCKSKIRTILVPGKLRGLLLAYAKRNGIRTGAIFVTRNGKPMNRSNIWAQMKALCEKARVKASKVFPHNLRKLFARTFYGLEKDIAKLADILGHTSVNTTRIYIMTTGVEHRRKIEGLGLVV
ncbi:MAG: tyrosine-type recombinase/integrase [Gemmiger sp.]